MTASAGSDDETDVAHGTDGKGGKTPEDKKEQKKSRGKKRGKKELTDDTKKDDKNASKKAKQDKTENNNQQAIKDGVYEGMITVGPHRTTGSVQAIVNPIFVY